jgi:hypothetical protein
MLVPILHAPDPDDALPWWRAVGEPFGWVLLVVLGFLVVAGTTRLLIHPQATFPHGISEGVDP